MSLPYGYFRCVVTRDGEALWLKNSMHCDKIMDAYMSVIDDYDGYAGRTYICLRVEPKHYGDITRDQSDWVVKPVARSPPKWYLDAQDDYNEAAWGAWRESVKENLVLSGENKSFSDKYVAVFGDGFAKVYGTAIVESRWKSTVLAYDRSKVYAYDRSVVKLHGNAVAVARNKSKVFANHYSFVRASDESEIWAVGKSVVEANGNVTVKAHLTSTVFADGYAKVNAFEYATVYLQGKAKAEAHDNSTVVALSGNDVSLHSHHAVLRRDGYIYMNDPRMVEPFLVDEV